MDLQSLINSQMPNTTLHLPPGEFFGQFTIDKPLTILGRGKATWIGARDAPTIRITSPGVVLQGLMIEVSGGTESVAVEANSGTCPFLKDVVVKGKVVGVRPENVALTGPLRTDPLPYPPGKDRRRQASSSWMTFVGTGVMVVAFAIGIGHYALQPKKEVAHSNDSGRSVVLERQSIEKGKEKRPEGARSASQRESDGSLPKNPLEMPRQGPVAQGAFGVEIRDLDEGLARSLGRTTVAGALVVRVFPGTPAEAAGIKPRDIVLRFNEETIRNSNDLVMRTKRSSPEATVTLEILRDKRTHQVTAELSERWTAIIKTLHWLAEQGDSAAQASLGQAFETGDDGPQDYEEAAKWYRKAADQGHAQAQAKIGWLHSEGKGVPKDYSEAVAWHRRAADQDNSVAQCSLGWMYELGRGVAQDYVEAIKWYRKAADRSDAVAQSNLGLMYEYGRGVAIDRDEAIRWYRKAAAQKNEKAMERLRLLGVAQP